LQFKNKLRLLTLAAIVAGILLGLFWAIPTAAKAPAQPNSLDIKNEEFIGPLQPTSSAQPIRTIRPGSGVLQQQKREIRADSGRYDGKTYSKEEVIQLIKDYSTRYGVDAKLPLDIAKCESGYNQFSKNKNSTASGVFQYLSSTWAGTDEGRDGLSVFDADANVRAAIKYIASRGHASPWLASKGCWG
jgi:hypothetical protein